MKKLGVALTIVLALQCVTFAAPAQKTFGSLDEAVNALVAAFRAADRKAMVEILGPQGNPLVWSGDDVADRSAFQRFVAAYDRAHRLEGGGGQVVLYVGEDDFPFPIPLVHKGDAWSFDTEAGRQEVLYRRIGANELDTIQVVLAYVDAQNEYADKDRGEGVGVYAQRVISQPGKKDGLYWPTAAGEEESPLGELAAVASSEGYKARAGGERSPFHGYYYKILTRQGPAAQGGVLDYVVKGKMIGGFALVAWPADYGNSGVMTFLVNHAGTVYEKDLGGRTDFIAQRTALFDPDQTWKKADAANP